MFQGRLKSVKMELVGFNQNSKKFKGNFREFSDIFQWRLVQECFKEVLKKFEGCSDMGLFYVAECCCLTVD